MPNDKGTQLILALVIILAGTAAGQAKSSVTTESKSENIELKMTEVLELLGCDFELTFHGYSRLIKDVFPEECEHVLPECTESDSCKFVEPGKAEWGYGGPLSDDPNNPCPIGEEIDVNIFSPPSIPQ